MLSWAQRALVFIFLFFLRNSCRYSCERWCLCWTLCHLEYCLVLLLFHLSWEYNCLVRLLATHSVMTVVCGCDQYCKMPSFGCVIVLSLFWSLVHCQQTFPYVSFGLTGQALVNHSYVDLSTVGSAGDNSDSVVCHTDLSTCCRGPHHGDWYFPTGSVLPFPGISVPIYEGRAAQIAVIRRTTATGPTGIYRCDISTVAVHDNTDISVRDTIYVGLYVSEGKRDISK